MEDVDIGTPEQRAQIEALGKQLESARRVQAPAQSSAPPGGSAADLALNSGTS